MASYQRDGRAIHKSKDRYTRTLGAHGLRAPQDPSALTVKSSADIALAPTGWPRTVAAEETLVVAAAGFRLSYWTQTKAALAGVEEVSDLDALVASEKGGLVPDAPDVQGFADARRQADVNRVAGATFDSLAKDLRDKDVHARNHAQGRMAALFRVQPGEALAAADTVLHDDLPDDARARILGALGSAGTPESQGALSSVIRASDAPPATRAAAAASLGLTDAPTEDSEHALVSAMSSPDSQVSSTAALGAGNLVQRMNAAGSGDSTSAVDALVAALQDAATDDQRTVALQALGNTGDPRALSAIEQYLAYPVAQVRSAAVFALRFMTGDSVVGDLGTAMTDPDVTVRRAAAGTLLFRSITPLLGPVTHALQTDADVAVRLSIVSAMAQQLAQAPGLASALQWSADHDPAPQVRKAAQTALASR